MHIGRRGLVLALEVKPNRNASHPEIAKQENDDAAIIIPVNGAPKICHQNIKQPIHSPLSYISLRSSGTGLALRLTQTCKESVSSCPNQTTLSTEWVPISRAAREGRRGERSGLGFDYLNNLIRGYIVDHLCSPARPAHPDFVSHCCSA